MADLQFNKAGTEQKSSSWIRTCKTGDQPYSDTSSNGEFSLDQLGTSSNRMMTNCLKMKPELTPLSRFNAT